MKNPLIAIALRVLAVACSLSMLGGYVWFSQRKAQSSVPVSVSNPGQVDATVPYSGGDPATLIPGSKSVNQPIFSTRAVEEMARGGDFSMKRPSTWLMSGSKTFNGASTVVADQLQLGKFREAVAEPTPSVMPGSKAGVLTLSTQSRVPSQPTTLMPGSKRSSGVLTPDQVDALLEPTTVPTAAPKLSPTALGPVVKPKAIMPDSKFAAIDLEFVHPPPAGGWTGDKPVPPVAEPKIDAQANGPEPSKPMSVRGKLGELEITPDVNGNLVLKRMPTETMRGPFSQDHFLSKDGIKVPADSMFWPQHMSSSKSGPVLLPVTSVDDSWFNWDLGEAIRDISAQLKRGFSPASDSSDGAPRIMSFSTKSAPVLQIPPKPTPSVLTLPDPHTPTAKP